MTCFHNTDSVNDPALCARKAPRTPLRATVGDAGVPKGRPIVLDPAHGSLSNACLELEDLRDEILGLENLTFAAQWLVELGVGDPAPLDAVLLAIKREVGRLEGKTTAILADLSKCKADLGHE